jgi:hypothetical protein
MGVDWFHINESKWGLFMDGIRGIETALWGYPKELMDKGEIRPKIKFVLDKRKWTKNKGKR